jgi:hypothetical protein
VALIGDEKVEDRVWEKIGDDAVAAHEARRSH